ncbi:MAG TPA: hypothetical protein VNM47_05600 [Terriglobia bacterium]|nr:hypothetical protein [Terriglobia bacterium]
MIKRNIRSWVITLALAAGLVSISQAFGAQNQNPNQERRYPPSAQQQPGAEQEPPEAQQPAQNQPHTYEGKIVKTRSGKYALLTDQQGGKGFILDNQKDAQKFEQQNVKVVATLDPHTMVLHVINIEPAS